MVSYAGVLPMVLPRLGEYTCKKRCCIFVSIETGRVAKRYEPLQTGLGHGGRDRRTILVDATNILHYGIMERVSGRGRFEVQSHRASCHLYGNLGQRRQIPHCWAFMLLGQIVAISFALNLCFTAVILFAPATRDLRDVHTQVDKADSEDRSGSTMSSTNTSTPSLLWYFPIFAVTFYAVYSVPYIVGQESFLQYLTIPHILLFFPAIYHNIMPRTWRKTHSSWAAGERYVLVVYQTICAVSFALHARTTLALFHDETTIFDTARNVIRALWEHPAVSSVGWDVILCFSSATIWRILQPASLERS